MPSLDRAITLFDRSLRVLLAPPPARRPSPAASLPDAELGSTQRRRAAGLMRVNHAGEVCAQALYQGQALFARDELARAALDQAAEEEWDHQAWCAQRLQELGATPSHLDPLWYGGALAIGVLAALAGDRWSLGFVAETERQVEAHLDSHLARLPLEDVRSRAIVSSMRDEEAAHAEMARAHGGAGLPAPVRALMRLSARVMTASAYWI
ncbi:MAG: 2-polyprenyl-3-methyl-6-methoxy-1,4-benzoquinone monooxygenase [Pseudomonadota bacterium]|nr:2-polyprenyl-3-methyl-6-methoxy-1,4-benzoquinone monooxygenase [Pseudomonadota bacterium]